MSDRGARTTIVVPVRALDGAKSRLGSVLDAEERIALVVRLLDRTLTASAGARSVAEAIVISPDPAVLQRAMRRGARTILQRGDGLNSAIEEARAAIAAGRRMLVVPGDLPGVSGPAIDALSAAADRAGTPVVALVPDRHGRGTNALLLDPPGVIPPAFGTESRAAHRAGADRAGVPFVELDGPLTLDIDTPDDLLLAETATPEALGVS